MSYENGVIKLDFAVSPRIQPGDDAQLVTDKNGACRFEPLDYQLCEGEQSLVLNGYKTPLFDIPENPEIIIGSDTVPYREFNSVLVRSRQQIVSIKSIPSE
jgi:hypothetical protein